MVALKIGGTVYRVDDRIHGLIMDLLTNHDLITAHDKIKLIYNCRGSCIKPVIEIYPQEIRTQS